MPAVVAADGKCSSCGVPLVQDDQDRYCPKCGRVVETSAIVNEPAYAVARDGTYVGQKAEPIKTTVIPVTYRDSHGAPIRNFRRTLRWLDRHTKPENEGPYGRRNYEFRKETERMVALLGLPTAVIDRAVVIVGKIREAGYVKGRPMGIVVGTGILIAARERGLFFPLRRFRTECELRWQSVATLYRLTVRTMKFDVRFPTPEDYIRKVVLEAGVSSTDRDAALDILHRVTEANPMITGNPISLAGAASYTAWRRSRFPWTINKTARVFGTTEVSIRTWKNEIARLGVI